MSLKTWQTRLKRRRAKLALNEKRVAWWKLEITRAKKHIADIKARRAAARTLPTLMYDSIQVSAIPTDARAVAGYTGGNWPTYPVLVKNFPKAKVVSIAVASRYNAEILDVEPGDATPPLAVPWMERQLAGPRLNGRRPGVYCSVSTAQDVVNRLTRAGIPRTKYRLWTAHYTGVPHICTAACGFGFHGVADATQYTSKALGRTLDASKCAPSFWT